MPRTKKTDEPLPSDDEPTIPDTAPSVAIQHNYYHDFYVRLKLQFYPGTEEPIHHTIDGTAVSVTDYHSNDKGAAVTNPA